MNQECNDNWIKYIESYQNEEITLKDVQEKYAERTKNIVDYAQKNSNFYREHLKTRNGESSKVEALSGIRYTTKDDLREVLSEICCLPYDEIGTYYETTGTTGKPTPCPRGIIDINTSGAYVKKALKEVYQETFGTTHALTAIMGPCELYAFGDTYGEVCRSLDIPFVRLWPESPRVGLQKAADLVTKLEVKAMICSPAIALALSRL